MSDVAHVFEPLPQVLKNVRYTGPSPLESDRVKVAISQAEAELSGSGRLLIRKSGTEPLIRVMAEGEDPDRVNAIVDRLVGVVEAAGVEAAE
jgi:phosphoglucosamine mutase